MILGIKFQAKPTLAQAKILSDWMGAAKFVWNAKCDEDAYLRSFARKYLPMGTFPPVDQTYSQYKDDILSPFLKFCPSQILRNSVSNWYTTYQKFFKNECGRPQRKKKGQGMSILLTNELFRIEEIDGKLKFFIGSKSNNIGILEINWHSKKFRDYEVPKSLRIKKLPTGRFTLSFCYGEDNAKEGEREEFFKFLCYQKDEDYLGKYLGAVDRGVNVACATDEEKIEVSEKAKKGLKKYNKRLKAAQKKLSKQKKGSKRREKTRKRIAKLNRKILNIRDDQCHHISKKIVETDKKAFILENLKIKNMTKSAKGTKEKPGKNVKQKSGLNRAILNVAWYKIQAQITYKAKRLGKFVYYINPNGTSQECANCGHTHPKNREGIDFKCINCGKEDHADLNAAKVIKNRAVKLILHSGTELSSKGVLRLRDKGRGADVRPSMTSSEKAMVKNGSSQKKRQKRELVKSIDSGCLEAQPLHPH
jgi:putative transposase